ncbi:MAG: amino acid permease, partial [Candidatus Latescibacteria bacterium]|nr:amino acid permease [Candidatus Latescibacterota bacterium]
DLLSVRSAFTFGWVGWFASIVAGVLYAMGFASYAAIALMKVWALWGEPPSWLTAHGVTTILAVGATAYYALGLIQKNTGSDNWINVAKVIVFAVLILGGIWALTYRTVDDLHASLVPFFSGGSVGLFQAMGYTFIALQGFDLIAAVAGEVKEPNRVLPRAMLLSLAAALGIYLPLLFVIATVGVAPGQSIATLSANNPEVVVALAAEHYLGTVGFWLVLVAAVLSMLSALQANLLAASRVALAMAQDRTLPALMGEVHPQRKTPITAVFVSALTMVVIQLVVPDVAAAGAAASLIFLISFALTHWTSILARLRRKVRDDSFQTPFFPLVPVVGGLCCAGLAVFQAISVPAAGVITCIWMGLGGLLYWALLAPRARVVDASAEALNPELMQLRGRSPLVLVPVANPNNAASMVAVAHALAPPGVGRVLLLSVVTAPGDEWQKGEPLPALEDTQAVLLRAVSASFAAGLTPEALTTIASQPWPEIVRVSRIHRCESLLLGLSDVNRSHLEELISEVMCDVVVLHAPPGWQLEQVKRVLVPTRGHGDHDKFRARLLGNLCRTGKREVTFLQVLPESAKADQFDRAERQLTQYAREEVPNEVDTLVVRSDHPAEEITRQAEAYDLVVLGLHRVGRTGRRLSPLAPFLAQHTHCATVMISRRG